MYGQFFQVMDAFWIDFIMSLCHPLPAVLQHQFSGLFARKHLLEESPVGSFSLCVCTWAYFCGWLSAITCTTYVDHYGSNIFSVAGDKWVKEKSLWSKQHTAKWTHWGDQSRALFGWEQRQNDILTFIGLELCSVFCISISHWLRIFSDIYTW